ncbi:hypothetical protein NG54_03445 [Heyndrickxia ginsengihumi]|uniref:DUF2634 domain-containing protein n=1 Tax=Heyndrickxia ginsengihumi TaxID=363870 RepID=A0A0A6VIC4_9BACI|nr:DUF2634 domain-containing protein [Heyndrickxia ginsengihumi]KHD86379.1 hypothetical protein NG54_03445 [Heyndrickxia ginsengihumi]
MFSPKILDGDIVIENGDVVMVEDDEELAQSLRIVLGTRKGEFALEPDHGLTFDNILGKQANEFEARDDIIEALSQDDRVSAVTGITFADDRTKRRRSISISVQKEDGTEIDVEGVDVDGAG